MIDPKKKGGLDISLAIGKPKPMKGGPLGAAAGAKPAMAKPAAKDPLASLDDADPAEADQPDDDEGDEATCMARIESKLDKIMEALQIEQDSPEGSPQEMGGGHMADEGGQ